MTVRQGCYDVRWDRELTDHTVNEFNRNGEYPELEGLPVVPCPLRAGSAVFHNAMGAHGAGNPHDDCGNLGCILPRVPAVIVRTGPNLTGSARRALLIAMIPEGHNQFNGQQSVVWDGDMDGLSVGDACDESFGAGGAESFSFPLLYRAPQGR